MTCHCQSIGRVTLRTHRTQNLSELSRKCRKDDVSVCTFNV